MFLLKKYARWFVHEFFDRYKITRGSEGYNYTHVQRVKKEVFYPNPREQSYVRVFIAEPVGMETKAESSFDETRL